MRTRPGQMRSALRALTSAHTHIANQPSTVRSRRRSRNCAQSSLAAVAPPRATSTNYAYSKAQIDEAEALQSSTLTTNYTNAIGSVQIGGRNLFKKNSAIVDQGTGSSIAGRSASGFTLIGNNTSNGVMRLSEVIPGNGTYTLSFDLYVNTAAAYVPLVLDFLRYDPMVDQPYRDGAAFFPHFLDRELVGVQQQFCRLQWADIPLLLVFELQTRIWKQRDGVGHPRRKTWQQTSPELSKQRSLHPPRTCASMLIVSLISMVRSRRSRLNSQLATQATPTLARRRQLLLRRRTFGTIPTPRRQSTAPLRKAPHR